MQVEGVGRARRVADRTFDVGSPHADRLRASEIPRMGGDHQQAVGRAAGPGDRQAIHVGMGLVGLRILGRQRQVPAQAGVRVDARERWVTGVRQGDDRDALAEPGQTGDGVRPGLEPLRAGSQRADRIRVVDPGIGGDACRSLEVDLRAAGVGAAARDDLLLLLVDVPLPGLRSSASRPRCCPGPCPGCRGEPSRLVDHGPEDVEDDHVHVEVWAHRCLPRQSRCFRSAQIMDHDRVRSRHTDTGWPCSSLSTSTPLSSRSTTSHVPNASRTSAT